MQVADPSLHERVPMAFGDLAKIGGPAPRRLRVGLAGHGCGRSSLAGRIGEDVQVGERKIRDEIQGVAGGRVGLAREAGKHIGSDGRPGKRRVTSRTKVTCTSTIRSARAAIPGRSA